MRDIVCGFFLNLLLIFVGVVVGWGTYNSAVDGALHFTINLIDSPLAGILVAVWSGLFFIIYTEERFKLANLRRLSDEANPLRVVEDVTEKGSPGDSERWKNLLRAIYILESECSHNRLHGLKVQAVKVKEKVERFSEDLGGYSKSGGWEDIDQDIRKIGLTLSDIVYIALLVPVWFRKK